MQSAQNIVLHTESALYILTVIIVSGFWIYLKFLRRGSHFGTTLLGKRKEEKLSQPPQPPMQTCSFLSPGTRDFVACNHLRSYKYYSESILSPDGFAAYPCDSYRAFESVSYFSTLSPTAGLLSCCVWDLQYPLTSFWPSPTCFALPLRVHGPEEWNKKKFRQEVAKNLDESRRWGKLWEIREKSRQFTRLERLPVGGNIWICLVNCRI